MEVVCKLWKKTSNFAKFNFVLLLIVLLIMTWLIVKDPISMRYAPYGAGDYYYTDVEGFDFSKSLGTKHPVLFFVLFIAWGLCAWYLLKWFESKK